MSLQACSKCGKRAFYYRSYSGEYLCEGCFITSIYENVKNTIRKYNMIAYGDRVVVGVSGGKDSLSLLYILGKFYSKTNEIIAVTLDEGIAGYREEGLEIARDLAQKLGLRHVVYTYKDLYGYPIDEIQGIRGKVSSCTICGVFRRRGLDVAARDLGANVVATAHNLDDVLQSYIITLINGDMERLLSYNPAVEESSAFGLRKVHPFLHIYEKELAMFAMLKGFRLQEAVCPYMNQGIRSEIRTYLNRLEERHPGIKHQLLNSFMKLSSERRAAGSGQFCERCGWPSRGRLCQVCSFIDYLSRQENKKA